METTSGRNRIHLSAAAAAKLRDQSPALAECLEPRGKTNVKGKGLMETYFLRPDPLSPEERLALLAEIARKEATAAAKERAQAALLRVRRAPGNWSSTAAETSTHAARSGMMFSPQRSPPRPPPAGGRTAALIRTRSVASFGGPPAASSSSPASAGGRAGARRKSAIQDAIGGWLLRGDPHA